MSDGRFQRQSRPYQAMRALGHFLIVFGLGSIVILGQAQTSGTTNLDDLQRSIDQAKTQQKKKSAAPGPSLTTVLVRVDAECMLSINGNPLGVIKADQTRKIEQAPGEALVECRSTETPSLIASQVKTLQRGVQAVAVLDLRSRLDATHNATSAEEARRASEEAQIKQLKEQVIAAQAAAQAASRAATLIQEQHRAEEDALAKRRFAEAQAAASVEEQRRAAEQAQQKACAANSRHLVPRGAGVLRQCEGGLEWRQSDNGRDISWSQASDFCNGLGQSWRLPSAQELSAILDSSGGSSTPCGGSQCRVSPNLHLTSAWFWTSDVGIARSSGTGGVILDLSNGARFSGTPGSQYQVRALCVRKS